MRLSYSRIGEHRECPQRWAFGQLDRLERDETAPPVELDYGTWWHALLGAYAITRGREAGSLAYAPDTLDTPAGKLIVDEKVGLVPYVVICAANAWWFRQSDEVRDVWADRLGITDLGHHLSQRFEDWCERWIAETVQERPLAVELWFERPIPGTELVLVGKIDEVYEDTRRGVVVIRDNKTGKSLDKGSTSLGDMMDGQLHLYSWGAAPRLAQLGIPALRAVAYDRARSVAAKEPQLTKAGKLSAAVKDFSVWDYRRWCESRPTFPGTKNDGSGAGVYEFDTAVAEKLSGEDELRTWFQRSIDPVNANVVAAHVQEAQHTAADIARTRATHAAGGGPGRNLGRSCGWCEFAKLCRSEMIGGRGGDYDLATLGLRKKENA